MNQSRNLINIRNNKAKATWAHACMMTMMMIMTMMM